MSWEALLLLLLLSLVLVLLLLSLLLLLLLFCMANHVLYSSDGADSVTLFLSYRSLGTQLDTTSSDDI